MPSPKVRRQPVQLDLLGVFDKPFKTKEKHYKYLLGEIKNLKFIRVNTAYTNFSIQEKHDIVSGLTDIINISTDILSGIGQDTIKFHHLRKAYYDKLSVDCDYLSVTEFLSPETIREYCFKATKRLLGFIIANPNTFSGFSANIQKLSILSKQYDLSSRT